MGFHFKVTRLTPLQLEDELDSKLVLENEVKNLDWPTDFKPGSGMGRQASTNTMARNQSVRSSPSGRQFFGKQIKGPKGKYFSTFLVPLIPCLPLFSPKERKLSDAQLFLIGDQERC